MDNGKVTLYLDHVRVKVDGATHQFLAAIALQIEAQTKVNIQRNGQIDTGFMLNSTYTVSKQTNTHSHAFQSGAYASRKSNSIVQRQLAPKVELPSNARAACVVGALYAIFQELKKPFLYPAAGTVAGQVGGQAEKVFREFLQDG